MRQDKEIAFKLRKDGRSYRDIQKELGISRSTLCDWFRKEEWSKHIKTMNNQRNFSLGKDRLKLLHDARNKMLDLKYKNVAIEAENEFNIFKKDPLFTAGLMIYAGEGDKRSQNNSRVSNSEFYLHNIFIQFAQKYLKINKENIKFSLIIYPDLDENECINVWMEKLNISRLNFYKTHTILGREKIKKLQYGIGTSIISSKVVVKKKILKWLELSSLQDF